MWSLVIFLCLSIRWAEAQNGRGPQHQDHNGHGWDIRLAVPGEPGSDYPTLGAIPRTSFSCAGREPGYYADLETNCQVFRVCTVGSTYGFQSFLCPNGTLFNQAVFVCDWWMNVDCQNSQQFFSNNNEKFENLRLGPQLMKDIKKMLTHPMLNPYDKTAMKSNLIVMQDYKPPFGQLFPNGALLAGPERAPNNIYVPAKQIQQNLIQGNPNDFSYSASTPDPRYIPASINTNFLPTQRDAEVFQRQRQNGQLNQNSNQNARIQTENSQAGNQISNGHAGRFLQHSNMNLANNNAYAQAQTQAPRPTQITNNFSQRQVNSVGAPQAGNLQVTRQRTQYSEPRRIQQTNNEAFSKIQNNEKPYNTQDKQPYTYSTNSSNIPQFSENANHPAGKELKQNLVSTIKDVPSTVITKTLTYSRLIQEPKVGKPKSRITVKTWIVKPTKAAKLIAEPTPYTYSRPSPLFSPSPSPTETLFEESTPYVYEKPTMSSQTEKIFSPEPESELDSEEPYVYTKPTPAAKQIRTTEIETTRIYIAPTTIPTRPTLSGRLNLPQTSPIPTKASRLYLTPSPFTSTARFYLPPPRNPTTLPRLYLPANVVQQPVYYQNAQLQGQPTIPSPTRVSYSENLNQPSFTLTKQSRINANHNNLTFADILTKEKLDITVNDIVKDTDDILKTASPPQYNQYRNEFKSLDYSQNNFFAPRTTTDSGENLTPLVPTQTPTVSSKSSRIVATPATSLQPPNKKNINQNYNQLSNLPFYKETALPNTIERTVSIKITIPERIAAYLFKNRSDSDYDKLEILNTGSSNYLVLSNNLLTKQNAFNFIPIARLIGNQNSNNISDSQALVYSFLTDSINVAREYNNIAQQEILSSTTTPAPAQFQNYNNEELSQITNKISQLTSSQYSSNNLNNYGVSANLISSQKTNSNQAAQFTGNARYTNEQNQGRQIQATQFAPTQQIQGELYSSRLQIPNGQQNVANNQNQVLSGQLYQWSVPDVTTQVYNRPSSENFDGLNNDQQQNTQMFSLTQNAEQKNVDDKQSGPQFEVIKAETVEFNPVKLQLEPPNESEKFNSQESLTSLLKSENRISAHLQDKIVGTIPHPLEENKLLTYKKDQSYYLYTKLEDNTIDQNTPIKQQTNINTQQNEKLTQTSTNEQNSLSYQLIPSVSYELDDEQEQQQILNAFQIDEFGAPRDITKPQIVENMNRRQDTIMTSSVDFSVDHPSSAKENEQYRINPLYSGPSSYTAPQSSVGNLGSRQVVQNNFISRLEDFDSNNNNNNGYPKDRPTRHFLF